MLILWVPPNRPNDTPHIFQWQAGEPGLKSVVRVRYHIHNIAHDNIGTTTTNSYMSTTNHYIYIAAVSIIRVLTLTNYSRHG